MFIYSFTQQLPHKYLSRAGTQVNRTHKPLPCETFILVGGSQYANKETSNVKTVSGGIEWQALGTRDEQDRTSLYPA